MRTVQLPITRPMMTLSLRLRLLIIVMTPLIPGSVCLPFPDNWPAGCSSTHRSRCQAHSATTALHEHRARMHPIYHLAGNDAPFKVIHCHRSVVLRSCQSQQMATKSSHFSMQVPDTTSCLLAIGCLPIGIYGVVDYKPDFEIRFVTDGLDCAKP